MMGRYRPAARAKVATTAALRGSGQHYASQFALALEQPHGMASTTFGWNGHTHIAPRS
jgi:hypothetical protein